MGVGVGGFGKDIQYVSSVVPKKFVYMTTPKKKKNMFIEAKKHVTLKKMTTPETD